MISLDLKPPREELPKHHVIVRFGPGFSADLQGRALLAFERLLREMGDVPAECFKETQADDSKLRRSMTAEQRARL